MIALNLEAKTKEQELIKAYLEENASEVLAEKINNGTPLEKDGKRLINRKTLNGFLNYACDEARKIAEKGARGACIEDKTVYGWAIHYFEEDSIEGALYNADGTEYKPKPKREPKAAAKPAEPVKPQPKQQTLFDFMEDETDEKTEREISEPKPAETNAETAESEPIGKESENEQLSDEELDEILKELSEEDEDRAPLSEAKTEERMEDDTDQKEDLEEMKSYYKNYKEIQDRYPACVIAYRIGDFYEIWGENAVMLAEELNITLTSRDCGLQERVPMLGFPYHAADAYLRKISKKHYLAVAEPLGEPKLLSGIPSVTETVDTETGEIITEVKALCPDAQSKESAIVCKLSELIGDIFIVR